MSFDYEALGKAIFQLEMPPFDAYLETICDFLKAETKKHREDVDDLREQIKSGKIIPTGDQDEMPWELQYEDHIDYLINEIGEYENILLKSFFVTIYGFLESQLMQLCRKLRKENNYINLSVSDLRGEDTLDRVMK